MEKKTDPNSDNPNRMEEALSNIVMPTNLQGIQSIILYEITIVLLAKYHNPSLLNQDFLKYNNIIPHEWQLAKNPMTVDFASQLTFSNGIAITAQLDKVIFTENLEGKSPKEIQIPQIVQRYIATLPHVGYRAIGINPRGYILHENERESIDFIVNNLIIPGPWIHYGTPPVRAGVNFTYSLGQRDLNLLVTPAIKTSSTGEKNFLVIFAGNFHYDLKNNDRKKRIEEIDLILSSWHNDIREFESLIRSGFIMKEDK